MVFPASPGEFWRSVRQLPARTPLRVKLITAVLTLVAIALAVISIAGISLLRSYLLEQASTTLQGISDVADQTVQAYSFNQQQPGPFYRATVELVMPDGTLHRVVPATGQYSFDGPPRFLPSPSFPTDSRWLALHSGQTMTVHAQSGGGLWLIAIQPAQPVRTAEGSTTGTIVVGVDVTSVYATAAKLSAIDLIVSAIVLVGLAVVGIGVIRASLRPLTEIEATARGIAAGDLSRRVPDRDPRTEIGRLGRALNVMLAQIEAAFAARAASEAAARRSEERMRQFVADASHELRTPLTAIRGFAEYYRQRGGSAGRGTGESQRADERGGTLEPADLNRIMRRVEQESARMGVLVEDMLMLARLDQQRPLEHQTVDLLTLAADAVHDARVVAPQRSINLTVGAGAALLVLGDETRLRQVIGNLMSNALGHTPEGTPVDVRIRSGRLDEGPGWAGPAAPAAVLEVTDQGPGLTPEQAQRVFERFYRADPARTSTSGGSGLGLAIVAALVAAHGGTVWVESPPGGGAVFRIALPLAPEALGGDLTADQEKNLAAQRAPGPRPPGTPATSAPGSGYSTFP